MRDQAECHKVDRGLLDRAESHVLKVIQERIGYTIDPGNLLKLIAASLKQLGGVIPNA